MPSRIQRDIKASGVRVRITEAGAGPSILLLHGLFFDHRTWDTVFDDLSLGFRVAAPDLPGFGASEKPAGFPYGIEAFADAIADLYAGLDLGRSSVVGHGLGGAVALTLASKHPELVERLVLVDSLCYPAPLELGRRIALLPLVGGFAFKQLWGRAAFRAYFKESVFAPGAHFPGSRIDEYYDAFSSPSSRASALATLRATVDTRAIVAHTARVGAESLVVWGRHDRIYPAAFGLRLSRDLRNSGFELLDSGHAPQEERPGELATLIARFCRAQRSGSSFAPPRSR